MKSRKLSRPAGNLKLQQDDILVLEHNMGMEPSQAKARADELNRFRQRLNDEKYDAAVARKLHKEEQEYIANHRYSLFLKTKRDDLAMGGFLTGLTASTFINIAFLSTGIVGSLDIIAISGIAGCLTGAYIPEVTEAAETARERCCRPRH